MTKYLISFPACAMDVPAEELPAVSDASHAVIEAAKQAGVYVFGGGVNEAVPPVMVSATGTVTPETYPDSRINGGFLVLEVTSREEAIAWARRVADACRCGQELREFMFDPAS